MSTFKSRCGVHREEQDSPLDLGAHRFCDEHRGACGPAAEFCLGVRPRKADAATFDRCTRGEPTRQRTQAPELRRLLTNQSRSRKVGIPLRHRFVRGALPDGHRAGFRYRADSAWRARHVSKHTVLLPLFGNRATGSRSAPRSNNNREFDQFSPIGLHRHCPPAAHWVWIVVGERCMLPAVGARFVPRGVTAIEIFVPVELGDRPATSSVAQVLYHQHRGRPAEQRNARRSG
jgi:hypothetical protein